MAELGVNAELELRDDMSVKKIKSYCRSCGQDTNHGVLSEHTESYREEYVCDYVYQIVECLGCETKSFREVFEDMESAYHIHDDEWEVPTRIDVYPKFIKGHRNLDGDYYLPDLVGRIYREVILAFQEDALVLAGLGLRGTVEAVCNDLGITGRNLEARISKLATAGSISRKDAERLHGIRFMGNDAAHEIKKPKKEHLSVALKIVEHLLSSVYILEEEVEGRIETTISDFEKFEPLLKKKVKLQNPSDELPLAAILGKDIRRVKESVASFETELLAKIAAGEITYLTSGKLDKYQGSKNDLQHYIIV
ncbi:DUF4145 domain-containing protein [Methylobacter sp. YRD-M1]|uniref:DUF4145 domain-containing protein n=1 Tax=Methylobacter sp. YRD-M1 TaxID=2911520 RepID=UPI00227C40AA|nr:DUF4145 domain-containing protein [Methylobacter sp. YRD-M1]WAK02395.1 DUF4145 domain-containing protein [Methylobacter sp. YRD-M1]